MKKSKETKANEPKKLGNLRDEEDWGEARGTKVHVGAYPRTDLDRTSWIEFHPFDIVNGRDQAERDMMTLLSSMVRITLATDPELIGPLWAHAYMTKAGQVLAVAQTSSARTTVVSRVPLKRLAYLGDPLMVGTSELSIDPLGPRSSRRTPSSSDLSGCSECDDPPLN